MTRTVGGVARARAYHQAGELSQSSGGNGKLGIVSVGLRGERFEPAPRGLEIGEPALVARAQLLALGLVSQQAEDV